MKDRVCVFYVRDAQDQFDARVSAEAAREAEPCVAAS